MKLIVAYIGQRHRSDLFDPAFEEYCRRLRAYTPVEATPFRTEPEMFLSIEKRRARMPVWVTLLESRGTMLSSEDFAAWLRTRREAGQQSVLLAVGPADGWSEDARRKAQSLLSFGPMTLPHELARVVLAEQLYRAFTILAGHPYHAGH